MLSATGGLAEVLRNMIQLCGLANCRGEPGDDSTLNGPRASSEAIFFWQLTRAMHPCFILRASCAPNRKLPPDPERRGFLAAPRRPRLGMLRIVAVGPMLPRRARRRVLKTCSIQFSDVSLHARCAICRRSWPPSNSYRCRTASPSSFRVNNREANLPHLQTAEAAASSIQSFLNIC
jgi:hypothetical protein